MRHPWYEFFAGGGMARLGLGERHWECTFANDICEKKASAYRAAFKSAAELKVGDISQLRTTDLPGHATMAWASFPCQDLSLAGAGAGLNGHRSGTFRAFWALIDQLKEEGRAPRIVVLENVIGAITSHDGRDFETIVDLMSTTGYRPGALVIDAVHFLPQSRPRLFIVGLFGEEPIHAKLVAESPQAMWHTKTLQAAVARLRPSLRRRWVWWKLPKPSVRRPSLVDVIQANPEGVSWNSEEETARLVSMMSPLNLRKLQAAQTIGKPCIGTVYKRIRPGEDGEKVQRAELRLDGIAGCLRTPVGGSSRQIVLLIHRKGVRSRLLSPREAGRLMGVRDSYPLPGKYNEAYHLFGDGVAVPVANWLSRHLLLPLASCQLAPSHSREVPTVPSRAGRQLSLTQVAPFQGM